ncbi:MAG TPA: hypothetical protein VN654_11705, partial [Vicinamibacterales bacterium]|nr:hypothetical protein [Vicinamibacterales bacterium]
FVAAKAVSAHSRVERKERVVDQFASDWEQNRNAASDWSVRRGERRRIKEEEFDAADAQSRDERSARRQNRYCSCAVP